MFLWFKFTYYLEIVIFVLRKKEKLVTPYMIFHHATFPIIVWIATNYTPGGHAIFVGVANTFFHTILFGIIILGTLWPHIKGKWFTNTIALTQVTVFWMIICRLSCFISDSFPTFIVTSPAGSSIFISVRAWLSSEHFKPLWLSHEVSWCRLHVLFGQHCHFVLQSQKEERR